MNKVPMIFLAILLLMPIPLQVNAEEDQLKTREDVLQFLESAFNAQLSLSEQARSMTEVEAVLQPFFTESFKSDFIKENVVEENGKYLTYGSDFAPYYIPFFEFSDATKVVFLQEKIYIVEKFPASDDGPVSYETHYEGLVLIKEAGVWKVNEMLHDNLPTEAIEAAYPSASEGPDHLQNQGIGATSLAEPVSINLWTNSLQAILGNGQALKETPDSMTYLGTSSFNFNLFN
ncbi:DUF3993 domain-containing protein [Mesobacillus foraminis]|uniref:DUF3993 domain-containing protein n=1 Tax=Mesobacillus foraminis TaxID=279826 RepID=UPI001BECDB9A|nr:DUF3993 domain-containing protein [Mesobacillus foraminis]MBT2756195.1 DUF3993 domain-containing protein [Mesobacillus foraminis]